MIAHRRCTLALVTLLGVAPSVCVAQSQSTRAASAAAATALYQRGEFEAAIAAAEQALRIDATKLSNAVVLVRALTDVGKPADALERVAQWRSQPPVAPAIAGALEALGKMRDASDAWQLALRGPDSLRAIVELARLSNLLRAEMQQGAANSVATRLDRMLVQANAQAGSRTASDLHAMATASRILGRSDPQRFKDALRFYDRAIALEPDRLDALVELGELFLEKFNFADSRTTLDKALAINAHHPRGLAALARLNAAEGRRVLRDPVARLLAVNSANVDAHVLLAYRLIDAEQYDEAIVEARRGLATDSTAPEPWVAIAAARWLARDVSGHRDALARAHLRLAGSAEAEAALADVSARNRLYADAVAFARAGVVRDPRDAHALALLGINLLRTGDVTTGRETLDRAFTIDPYDVRVKNTLDLLDSYATARTVATEHFDLVLETGDAELMSLYASPLAEEAYAALTVRYGFVPSDRVRMEFFRSHADFSVRAVGLAGLGALGVAFGNVLAIDLPPARSRGEFHWGAVLWHEFAHTITLGMTNNRVPRWVSEGLSVHEERRARREWGGGATPMLIAAYGAGRLQPVSRLNNGFVHPRYEQEVILSYALSAYVFEMLEELKGMAGIRALLLGYRDGSNTPQLMQQVYGLDSTALDATFDRWFRAKFSREFAAVRGTVRTNPAGETSIELAGPLRDALGVAGTAMQQKQWPEVVQAAQRAVALFPSFAEPGSGYHFLVAARTAMGDTANAAVALAAIVERNAEAIDENIALASMLQRSGDSNGAMAALDRASSVDPFDVTVQTRLGDVAFASRAWPLAIRARRAVLAIGPTDRADALYRLAQALTASGDFTTARREVLRALDLAPNFEAAQDLLLTIRSSGKAP